MDYLLHTNHNENIISKELILLSILILTSVVHTDMFKIESLTIFSLFVSVLDFFYSVKIIQI